MKQQIKNLLILIFVLGFAGTSCEDNDIIVDGEAFPETEGIGQLMGILRSVNYAKDDPLIDMNHEDVSDVFNIELTEPATQEVSYTASIDEAQVAIFNTKYEVDYPLFPTEFVNIGEGGKMTLKKGDKQSNSISISFKFDESLTDTIVYLLPITVEPDSKSSPLSEKRRTLYYRINMWGEGVLIYEANYQRNYIQISGVDPEITNPLLLSKLYLECYQDPGQPSLIVNPYDIINLQSATVKADENNLPYLYLNDDLAYVLSKRGKYIIPLKKYDRKICLTIKGGGEGIGFSNLSGTQLSVFVYRIKQMLEQYELDGVNMYDIGFGIDESEDSADLAKGLCRFVSLLRKELGDKIISYIQTSESPAEITEEQDGIKLGELIDYAWTDQLNKIINPWDRPDEWWNKPIAGLAKEKWGALNAAMYSTYDDQGVIWDDIESPNGINDEGVNHVFVHHRVEETEFKTESTFRFPFSWGWEYRLWEDTGGSASIRPQGYYPYDKIFVPKDY